MKNCTRRTGRARSRERTSFGPSGSRGAKRSADNLVRKFLAEIADLERRLSQKRLDEELEFNLDRISSTFKWNPLARPFVPFHGASFHLGLRNHLQEVDTGHNLSSDAQVDVVLDLLRPAVVATKPRCHNVIAPPPTTGFDVIEVADKSKIVGFDGMAGVDAPRAVFPSTSADLTKEIEMILD